MITFACKNIRLEDLVRCSFDLNKTEYAVLLFLLEQENSLPVVDIAKKMGFERTTVQKAIKKLVQKKLVKRLQQNFEQGGYQFIYHVCHKKKIKSDMKEIVHRWHSAVIAEIDKW